MTRILVVLILGEIGLFAQCPCRKTERGESTHWGGNQLVVLVDQKAHKRLRGIVLDPHREPMPGALIEVFTNPDYLLHDGPSDP